MIVFHVRTLARWHNWHTLLKVKVKNNNCRIYANVAQISVDGLGKYAKWPVVNCFVFVCFVPNFYDFLLKLCHRNLLFEHLCHKLLLAALAIASYLSSINFFFFVCLLFFQMFPGWSLCDLDYSNYIHSDQWLFW